MKIALIGLSDADENIFPKLGSALAKKISGIEIVERFAPMPEDLPMIALEESQESDFLIVFALIDDVDVSDFIKRKLVDVELASKTRILKIIDLDSIIMDESDEFIEESAKIIDGIVNLAANILFNERAFTPKPKVVE
jgi:hypothetical protein